MSGLQFNIRGARGIWLLAFGVAAILLSCCGFLTFVVGWFTNPGWDRYDDFDHLNADFDEVHVIIGSDLFTKRRMDVGRLIANRQVFVAIRRDVASLYVWGADGGLWKFTPERVFEPTPCGDTMFTFRFAKRVLWGRWYLWFPFPVGKGETVQLIDTDECSVTLDDSTRVK